MEYVGHVLVFVAIYVILAVSLDLLAGHTGMLSVAPAAFYGLGAYTSALLTVEAGASFLVALLAGMIVAGVLSLAVSLPSLRLVDEYFVIATFALQIVLFSLFNNWVSLTGGPMGIPGIPPPAIFGIRVTSRAGFLVMASLCAGLAYTVVWRLSTGPFGRALHAIREDEVFAKAAGKDTVRLKITAFAISVALAAMAGSLYAHYISYIDPSSFTVMESILIISMVILGGAGSLWGPLIGAIALVTLPEALRFLGLPSSVAANLRQVVYGALLLLVMLLRPRGLVGKYAFGQ